MKVSELEIKKAPEEPQVPQIKRTIKEPYWSNNDKTQVGCQFVYEDGRHFNVVVSDTADGNPDWKEIFENFNAEEIDKNTEEMLDRNRKQQEQREKIDAENAEKMKQEILFQAKLEAFEIEEIKNSQDRDLKSKIRKSKNLTEVQAYASILIMKELEKSATAE